MWMYDITIYLIEVFIKIYMCFIMFYKTRERQIIKNREGAE